jgi:hypothetical protein
MSASDRTVSGIPIDAVYGGGPGVPDGLPPPGQCPYTPGLHPEVYRTRFWMMRMFSGLGWPEDTSAGGGAATALPCAGGPLVSVFPTTSMRRRGAGSSARIPKLIHFNRLEQGGHFAAWEQPELFTSGAPHRLPVAALGDRVRASAHGRAR